MLRRLLASCALLSLAACSETATSTDVPAPQDHADVTVDAPDAPDAPDVPDVPDAPDVADVTDAPDASDVADVTADRPDARDVIDIVCDAGLDACAADGGSVCVDTRTDPRHCGACGRACCPGQFCAGGMCVLGCPAGQTVCTPAGATCPTCFDTSVSPAHCGMCNNPCAAGQTCVAGRCTGPGCAAVTEPPPPMGVCDGRGRIACELWAQGIAGGNPNATAQCVSMPSGCVRADRCDDIRDPSTCRCGAEPACGPNQVCVLTGPTARCQCARP